jgi:hypothetical protein
VLLSLRPLALRLLSPRLLLLHLERERLLLLPDSEKWASMAMHWKRLSLLLH